MYNAQTTPRNLQLKTIMSKVPKRSPYVSMNQVKTMFTESIGIWERESILFGNMTNATMITRIYRSKVHFISNYLVYRNGYMA